MERKKNYSKPVMFAERFTPQNYCQVCYIADGTGQGHGGFMETNGVPGPQIVGGTTEINGLTVHYDPDRTFLNGEYYYIRSDKEFEWVMPKDRPSTAPTGDPDFTSVPWMAWYSKDTNGGQFNYLIDLDGDIYYHLNYKPRVDGGNHS